MLATIWMKRIPAHCRRESKLVQTLERTEWGIIFLNLKIELPFDITTSFLSKYPKKMKSTCV